MQRKCIPTYFGVLVSVMLGSATLTKAPEQTGPVPYVSAVLITSVSAMLHHPSPACAACLAHTSLSLRAHAHMHTHRCARARSLTHCSVRVQAQAAEGNIYSSAASFEELNLTPELLKVRPVHEGTSRHRVRLACTCNCECTSAHRARRLRVRSCHRVQRVW